MCFLFSGSCGPVTENLIPDVTIVATEPDANIALHPNFPANTHPQLLCREGYDGKFKVPQLIVEVVGKKDEWGWLKAVSKGVREASYTLHFYPRAYFMLIWNTEIGIYRVERVTNNNNEGILKVYQEIIHFNPEIQGSVQAEQAYLNVGTTTLAGVDPPPSSDISQKLHLVANRVLAILLECHRDKNFAATACNDLRYMLGNPNPVPASPEGCQLPQLNNMPHGSGFKPMFHNPAIFPDNQHAIQFNPQATAQHGNVQNLAQPPHPMFQLPKPRDKDHVGRHPGSHNRVQKCCPAGQQTFACHHATNMHELQRRFAAYQAGTVAYNPLY